MRVRRFLYLVLMLLAVALLWQIIEVSSQPLPSPAPSIPTLPPQELFLPAAARPDAAEGEMLAAAIAQGNPFDFRRGQKGFSLEAEIPPPTHLKVTEVLQDEVVFVDSSQEGKVVRARKGEAVGPYRVQEVTSTSVTLAYGSDQTAVLFPPPSHLKVIGILQDEAVFVDSLQEGKLVYAHKGEAVGPYRVQEVTSTSVTFAYGFGQTTVLSLPWFDGAGGLRIEVVPGK